MSIRLNFCRSVPPEFLRSFFQLICPQATCEIITSDKQESFEIPCGICETRGSSLPNTILLHLCVFSCLQLTMEVWISTSTHVTNMASQPGVMMVCTHSLLVALKMKTLPTTVRLLHCERDKPCYRRMQPKHLPIRLFSL